MKRIFCFLLLVILQYYKLPNVALATTNFSLSQREQRRTKDDNVEKLLLAFKESSVQSDSQGFLSDWKHNSSIPVCSWKGLTCSPQGHVTTLNLWNAGIVGSLHLPTLTALPSLQNLLFLRVVSIWPRSTSGNSIPGGSFRFGASLLQLDISRNRISDSSLLTCQNLNLLNVSGNKLTGKLSGSILSCKNLTTLDLSYNALSGEIPNTFLESASASLKYLDLSSNNFTGKFASLGFGQCSSLTLLKLSHNNLYGDEFPSSLANCQALETLNLTSNKFQDKIPGALLGNLKKLRQLFLGRNQFSGVIPAELGKACGTLQELDISDNILTGELPSSFVSCTSLVTLNLGRNQLSGNFLNTVVSKLPSLRYLYAPFNSITGPVPPSITNGTRLQVLDLSANLFTGNVPSGFCSSNAPSALEKILLANNFLSGTVPSELGNCKNLRAIDLSFNNLSGAIPSEIWTLPKLSDLVMWANKFTGEIPEGICVNGGNLETLILNNNLISGAIPQSIGSCTHMIDNENLHRVDSLHIHQQWKHDLP
ncbi:hypothetical protein ACLB2K_021490 [Fragaria x ananassa]